MHQLAVLLVVLDNALMRHHRPDIAEAADALVGYLEKQLPLVPADMVWLDWRHTMNRHQLTCYARDIRAVAEI